MLFAVPRPQASLTMPARQETDPRHWTSGQHAGDRHQAQPAAAAQAAAKAFVAKRRRHVRIGAVVVAGRGGGVQSLTDNRE
jgi:hypothetical protein